MTHSRVGCLQVFCYKFLRSFAWQSQKDSSRDSLKVFSSNLEEFFPGLLAGLFQGFHPVFLHWVLTGFLPDFLNNVSYVSIEDTSRDSFKNSTHDFFNCFLRDSFRIFTFCAGILAAISLWIHIEILAGIILTKCHKEFLQKFFLWLLRNFFRDLFQDSFGFYRGLFRGSTRDSFPG